MEIIIYVLFKNNFILDWIRRDILLNRKKIIIKLQFRKYKT